MKTLLHIILFLFLTSSAVAQVKIKGKITALKGDKKVPVELANIILYSKSDSTKFIAGTVSDLEGNYLFPNIEMGRYRLVISCVGYKTLRKMFRVTLPSVGDHLTRNFQLKVDNKALKEVVVMGNRRKQYVDKATYTFKKQEIKSAQYAKDLLENLPDLSIDVQTQKLKTINGQSLLILINGVRATNNDLKMIPPNKILRVEYFDMPPARYAGKGAVVNVITKTLDDGFGGGVDISHAFSTGFGNDNAYFSYHNKRHKLAVDYSINYRDYNEKENNNSYKYLLDNKERESLYQNNDAFGYTTHTIGLKYTNSLADKSVFELKVQPNFETRFFDRNSTILNRIGNIQKKYTGTENNDATIFKPVVDVYYWKKLSPNSEITANVVGTMFRTSVTNHKKEYFENNNTLSLSDNMDLENRKQSLIGELIYSRSLGLKKWDTGYEVTASWLKSDIKNTFGNFNYHTNTSEHYLYSELTGNAKRLMYRISMGATYIATKSYAEKRHNFTFTPTLLLGYNINPHNTIRLILGNETTLPSLSNLSNNAQLITSDIVRVGNPNLKNSSEFVSGLIYNFNNKYFTVNTALLYRYADKPINTYFQYIKNDRYIKLMSENAIFQEQYGGLFTGKINPLGTNLLAIKIDAKLMRQHLKSNAVGTVNNWYCPIYIQGALNTGKLMISYEYRFTDKSLSGAYLNDDENASNLFARYKLKKNISLTAGVYWLFTTSKYRSETLPNSLVKNISSTKINDNKTMFVVGFSWNFNKGKSYKVKRSMQNADNDAVTF